MRTKAFISIITITVILFCRLSSADSPSTQPTSQPAPLVHAIFAAAQAGDIEKAAALLKTDPALVFIKDKTGHTPLHYAAANGRVAMAKLLLPTTPRSTLGPTSATPPCTTPPAKAAWPSPKFSWPMAPRSTPKKIRPVRLVYGVGRRPPGHGPVAAGPQRRGGHQSRLRPDAPERGSQRKPHRCS